MAYKIHSVVLLVALIVTVSCSQKASNVKLEVSHNFAFAGSPSLQAVAGGGLMVWGKSSTGDAFAQTLEGTDDLNLQLTNGSWTFFAMAWDGSKKFDNTTDASNSTVFGGIVRCAKSLPVSLNGSPVSVDLSLNNGSCTDTTFAGTVPTTTVGGNVFLAPTQFTFCRGLAQITDGTKLCTDTKNDTRQKERKAWIGSFKVKMKSFKVVGGSKTEGLPLSSKCVEMKGDPEPTAAGGDIPENYGGSQTKISGLPAGGAGIPFAIELEMFPGNRFCDVAADGALGLRGSITRNFPSGIISDLPISNKYFTTASLHKQYINVPSEVICNGRNGTGLGDHTFAAGEGSAEHPYIICSVPQFHSINNNILNLAKHFKLEANLDFNPYSNGLAGTGVVPALFQCLEMGSNFIPIGYYNTTCAGPGSQLVWNTLENFTGTFNGAGFTLSNMRLRAESQPTIGMFASINGSARVSNFNLENSEISGKYNVGGVSGLVDGTTDYNSVLFWSINGKKLEIEARDVDGSSNSAVGSLFGNMSNATLSKSIVRDSKVRGEGSLTGGISGMAQNSLLDQVSAEVDINADSGISNKHSIGGVVGYILNTNMNYVKHEGGIYTNATSVGPIAGSFVSGNLTNFYAISNVYTQDGSANPNIGGVVGEWGSTGIIGPGYSISSVRSTCGNCNPMGRAVGLMNNTPGTANPIYVPTNAEAGALGTPPSFSSESSLSMLSHARIPAMTPALVDSGSADWSKAAGEYPRFDFEFHPCSMGFSNTGAGTLVSPTIICNETAYLSMGSASGQYFKLGGTIRISNVNGAENEILTFDNVLDGNGKSVIAGNSTEQLMNNEGHIKTNNGTIKNIKFHGLSRNVDGNPATNPNGTLVAINNGIIQDVQAWVFPIYTAASGTLVGKNNGSGIIRKVSVENRAKVRSNVGGLVYENAGLIEGAYISGELTCIDATFDCSNNAAFAVKNSGTIRTSESSLRYRDQPTPYLSNDISMIVDQNISPGLIQDVVISQHSEFEIAGDYAHQFFRTNTGTLTRVINNGKFLAKDTSQAATITGFPSGAPTGGTLNSVLRSGGRSGQQLLRDKPYFCNDAGGMKIAISGTNWATIPDAANWNTFLNTYNGITPASDQKLVVDFKVNNGPNFTQRVTGWAYSSPNYELTLPVAQCVLGDTGTVSVYWTDDIPTTVGGSGVTGTMLPQSAGIKSNYGSPWEDMIWNKSIPADRANLMSYYAYILGVSSTAVTPRVYELEDEGLRIFNLDH